MVRMICFQQEIDLRPILDKNAYVCAVQAVERGMSIYVSLGTFGLLFPMFQPQPRSVLTTFGVTAAVIGTLTKMKDLCIA